MTALLLIIDKSAFRDLRVSEKGFVIRNRYAYADKIFRQLNFLFQPLIKVRTEIKFYYCFDYTCTQQHSKRVCLYLCL